VIVKLYYELSNIEAGGTFNCNINANPENVILTYNLKLES